MYLGALFFEPVERPVVELVIPPIDFSNEVTFENEGAEWVEIREVQVHGAAVDRSADGGRTALNLAGVEAGDLRRGLVLAAGDEPVAVEAGTAVRGGAELAQQLLEKSVGLFRASDIMGRVSAYTGKEVTWDEMMNSDMKLGPATYVMGPVGIVETSKVAIPGDPNEA